MCCVLFGSFFSRSRIKTVMTAHEHQNELGTTVVLPPTWHWVTAVFFACYEVIISIIVFIHISKKITKRQWDNEHKNENQVGASWRPMIIRLRIKLGSTDHLPPAGWGRRRRWCRCLPSWPQSLTTWGQSQGLAGLGPGGGDQGYQRLTTPDPQSKTSTVLPSLGLTTKIRLYLVWAVLSATRCPGRRGQVSRRSRLPLNENGIGDQKIESIGREICSVLTISVKSDTHWLLDSIGSLCSRNIDSKWSYIWKWLTEVHGLFLTVVCLKYLFDWVAQLVVALNLRLMFSQLAPFVWEILI